MMANKFQIGDVLRHVGISPQQVIVMIIAGQKEGKYKIFWVLNEVNPNSSGKIDYISKWLIEKYYRENE